MHADIRTLRTLGPERLFKNIGEKFKTRLAAGSTEPCVDRKIHFVWVTSAIPSRFLAAVHRVANQNAAFETQLWLDTPLRQRPQTRTLLNVRVRNVSEVRWFNADYLARPYLANPGILSDLLRLEIVHKEGGIYLDIDVEPVAPLEGFQRLGFLRAPFLQVNLEHGDVSNGFFGFGAGSPFLAMAMRLARENLDGHPSALRRKRISVIKIGGGSMLASALLVARSECIQLLADGAVPRQVLRERPARFKSGQMGAFVTHAFLGTWQPAAQTARANSANAHRGRGAPISAHSRYNASSAPTPRSPPPPPPA